MNYRSRFFRIVSGTFFIAGTMIGAGMLGIPLVTGPAGFFPGCFITCVVWLFMYATGMLLLEAILWMPDKSNILSITAHFFGKRGRYFAGFMFLFLYYSLMVAYFAAGVPLLADAFAFFGITWKGWEVFLIFGFLFGGIVATGPKSIDRFNRILGVGLLLSWVMLIGVGSPYVQKEYLTTQKLSLVSFAAPVLFSAFGFHNVLPSLCTYLMRDKRAMRLSIFWGSFLPLIVYLIWQWLIMGAIPEKVLTNTLAEGMPVTNAFALITGDPYFVMIGRFFAFFAITTSLLGVSFSMVDFLADGLHVEHRRGVKRLGLTVCTFAPPCILALVKPDIFGDALGIAGGFGEAFLNGLLPIALVWVGKYRCRRTSDLTVLGNRWILILLICFSVSVMFVEFLQLFKN